MNALPKTIRFRPPSETQRAVVDLLDQTCLPNQVTRLECFDVDTLHDAIVRLVVRGAPAIGVAAAYGVLLAEVQEDASLDERVRAYRIAADRLATSRPTAVNLFWALDAMRSGIDRFLREEAHGNAPDPAKGTALQTRLVEIATQIDREEAGRCQAIGEHGAAYLDRLVATDSVRILTHCNAGALATTGIGTALAPVYCLHQQGRSVEVIADETRPLLQGARLTAWELATAGVSVTVCTDSMAAQVLSQRKIDAVIVGADRIAANGDVANKIGTYGLAVAAKHHGVPFLVAAPISTFDSNIATGDLIPIEQRSEKEIRQPDRSANAWTPREADVMNPAFDVTPAGLIQAIVTQLGVIERPTELSVATHLNSAANRSI
ncbi:MAG: S-methyl-5-thioribose-1-phosphate isomerase [Planctomycetota bacterium]